MNNFALTLIMAATIFATTTACGPNQRILNSAHENRTASQPNEVSSPQPALSSFERDLAAMRNAEFKFIYVFRRRDGGVLDADDKSFVTQTSPPEMNRRTLSDEGRTLLIGSNFRMPPETLEAFSKRFVFEDHSVPEFRETVNSNQNRMP